MAKKINYKKNGQEYFRVTKTFGGERKEFYGTSKKEAEAKRDEYAREYEKGLIANSKATLGTTMYTWLFEVVRLSDKIKDSSFERYEGIYRNYIKESPLYNSVLRTLKSLEIQRYYNRLYEEDGKTYSQILSLHKLLRSFLFYAVDGGYLEKNPCSGKRVTIPGKATTEEKVVEIFSDEELIAFQKALLGHQYEALFLLALGTGLRQGELIALKEDEVDLENCLVNVDETARMSNVFKADGTKEYKLVIGTTKNRKKRQVPFPERLVPKLKEYKKLKTAQELKAYPGTYKDEGFFFSNQLGGPVDARTLRRSLARVLKSAGIPYRKFHASRHTFATKLFEKDVSIKSLQALLGHNSLKTTDIYTQVLPHKKIEAVNKLNDLFL